MQKSVNPKQTIELLQSHDFTVQKKYGQNFLVDERVVEKIIAAAGITKEDCVLEIGPGMGSLTQYLAEAAGHVVAVEIDRMLVPILQETLRDYDNVTVLNQDILKTDIMELTQRYHDGAPVKVVANLPYYITTPIIMQLLESRMPLRSITVMVQKEVADRMQAKPGSKDYGALSLAVQYYSRPQIAANVPPNCFIPRPKVGSAVIHLDCEGMPVLDVKDEKLLFALIRASFNQRRKTLVNGLKNAPGLSFDREQILNAVKKLGWKETVRGEELTLEQFAYLADFLHDAVQ